MWKATSIYHGFLCVCILSFSHSAVSATVPEDASRWIANNFSIFRSSNPIAVVQRLDLATTDWARTVFASTESSQHHRLNAVLILGELGAEEDISVILDVVETAKGEFFEHEDMFIACFIALGRQSRRGFVRAERLLHRLADPEGWQDTKIDMAGIPTDVIPSMLVLYARMGMIFSEAAETPSLSIDERLANNWRATKMIERLVTTTAMVERYAVAKADRWSLGLLKRKPFSIYDEQLTTVASDALNTFLLTCVGIYSDEKEYYANHIGYGTTAMSNPYFDYEDTEANRKGMAFAREELSVIVNIGRVYLQDTVDKNLAVSVAELDLTLLHRDEILGSLAPAPPSASNIWVHFYLVPEKVLAHTYTIDGELEIRSRSRNPSAKKVSMLSNNGRWFWCIPSQK